MASTNLTNQVNNIPQVPNGSNDGTSGPITTMKHASFINLWVQGSSNQVYVPGLTALSVQETSDGFDLVATAGTFNLEPKMGVRKFSGTFTRLVPRGLTIKNILRAAYAIPANQPSSADIRPDMLPVSIIISYQLVGPGYNYNAPIDYSQALYGQATITTISTQYIENATSFVTENITFMGQFENATDSQYAFTTKPFNAGFAKYSAGSNS